MFENVSEAVDFDLEYQTLAAPVVSSIWRLMAQKNAPVLVGVCGRSRAGKTVTAHAIVRALSDNEISCLHVRLDDWIVPVTERGADCTAETRNRIEAMPSIIKALRAGAMITGARLRCSNSRTRPGGGLRPSRPLGYRA